MPHRLKNRLKFRLERWLQRGALFQLVVIAALIVAVAVTGGLVAWAFSGAFAHPAEAIWWAFLRLTDPGYLGDDAGLLLRTVSTIVTVLGYVLFMGSLIAIMTQWLNGTLRTLERGLTPIALRDHLLILGWTNRTAAIVAELLLSEERVRRLLRREMRDLRVAVLVEEPPERFRSAVMLQPVGIDENRHALEEMFDTTDLACQQQPDSADQFRSVPSGEMRNSVPWCGTTAGRA